MAQSLEYSAAERAAKFGIDCGDGLTWIGGSWSAGGEYTRKLTVKNVAMRMQKVRYTLPKTKIFFMEFPDGLTLSSGMSVQLEVRFRPVRLQAYHDSITFHTDAGSFAVPVRAELPKLAVQPPDPVHFGLVPINEPSARPVRLRNVGQVPATYAWDVPPPFSVDQPHGSLAAGEEKTLTVTCLPSSAAVLAASSGLLVDGGAQRFEVPLSATAKYQHITLSESAIEHGEALIRSDGAPYDTVIQVRNTGPVPATVTIAPQEGDRPPLVKLTPPLFALPAGASQDVRVRYTPAVHGVFTVENFHFGTPGGNTAKLQVRGRAVGPSVTLERKDPTTGTGAASSARQEAKQDETALALTGTQAVPAGAALTLRNAGAGSRGGTSPISFNFGNVQVGESVTRLVTLRNHSHTEAFFDFTCGDGGVFRFEHLQGSIPALLYKHIVITFTPPTSGSYYRRVLCLVRDGTPVYADLLGSGIDSQHRPLPLKQRHIDAYRLRPPPVKLLTPAQVTAIANALTGRASAAIKGRGDPALRGLIMSTLARSVPLGATGRSQGGAGGVPSAPGGGMQDDVEGDIDALLGGGIPRGPQGGGDGPSLWRLPLQCLEGDHTAASALVSTHQGAMGAFGDESGSPNRGSADAALLGAAVRMGSRAPFGLLDRDTLLAERELTMTGRGPIEATNSGHLSRAAAALFEELFSEADAEHLPLALLDSAVDFGFVPPQGGAGGGEITRTVRIANRSMGKMTVQWVVPPSPYSDGNDFRVHPESADVNAQSIGSFEVTFRPSVANVHCQQQLEAYVAPKANRTFRLVDDESLTPPTCLPLRVRGSSFATAGSHLSPAVQCSLGRGSRMPLLLPPTVLGEAAFATFQLTNSGDTSCTFTFESAALTGGGDGGAQWDVSPRAAAVPPGSFTLVTVKCRPTAARTHHAALKCVLNGSPLHSMLITAQCAGDEPRLALPPGGLVFVKPTCIGVASVATAVLRNPTRVPLRYKLKLPRRLTRDGILTAAPLEGEIRGNDSATVQLRFAPRAAGRYAMRLGVEVFPAGRYASDWLAPPEAVYDLPPGTGYAQYAFEGGHISAGAVVKGGSRAPTAEHFGRAPTAGVRPYQSLTLMVLSEATGGAIEFNPPHLGFGTALVGATLHRNVTLVNRSDCTLHFKVQALMAERESELDHRDGGSTVVGGGAPHGFSETGAPDDSDSEGDDAVVGGAAAAEEADMGLHSLSLGDSMLAKAAVTPPIVFDPPSGVIPAHASLQMDVAFTPPKAASFVFRVYYTIVSEAEHSGENKEAVPGDGLNSPSVASAGGVSEYLTPPAGGTSVDLGIAASQEAAEAAAAAAASDAAGHAHGASPGAVGEGSLSVSGGGDLARGSASTILGLDPDLLSRERHAPNANKLWCEITATGGYPSVTFEDARCLSSTAALLYLFPSPPAPVGSGDADAGTHAAGGVITMSLPPALARGTVLAPANSLLNEGHFAAASRMPHALALLGAGGVDTDITLAVGPDGVAVASTASGSGGGTELDGVPVGGNAVGGWGFFVHGPLAAPAAYEALMAGLARPAPALPQDGGSVAWARPDSSSLGGTWGGNMPPPEARDVVTGGLLQEHSGGLGALAHVGALARSSAGGRGADDHVRGALGGTLSKAGHAVTPVSTQGSPWGYWRQLSLAAVNRHLSKRLTDGEISFNRATRNETAEHTLKTYVMEFTPAPLGSPPEVVLLSVRNNGALPAVLDFRFTHQHEFDVEPWAEVVEPSHAALQVAELTGRRVVDVQPRRAALLPGESATVRLHYAYVSSMGRGRHEVPVIMRLSRGKQVRLLLRGRTLNPAFPFLYAGVPRGVLKLKSVPVAMQSPPAQPVVIRNTSSVALAFSIDTDALKAVAEANFGFPVFTATAAPPAVAAAAAAEKYARTGSDEQTDAAGTLLDFDKALHSGIIPAGGAATVWVTFKPLEGKTYMAPLRVRYTFGALQDGAFAGAAATAVRAAAAQRALMAEQSLFAELGSAADGDDALLLGTARAAGQDAVGAVLQEQEHMLRHALGVDPSGRWGLNPLPYDSQRNAEGEAPPPLDRVITALNSAKKSVPEEAQAFVLPLPSAHPHNGDTVEIPLSGAGFVLPSSTDELRVLSLPAQVAPSAPCGAQQGAGYETLREAARFVSGIEDGTDEDMERTHLDGVAQGTALGGGGGGGSGSVDTLPGAVAVAGHAAAPAGAPAVGGEPVDEQLTQRHEAAEHARRSLRVLSAHENGMMAGTLAEGATPLDPPASEEEGGPAGDDAASELSEGNVVPTAPHAAPAGPLPPIVSQGLVKHKPRPGESPPRYFGANPPPRRFVNLPAPWLGEAIAKLSHEHVRFGDVPARRATHRVLVLYNCRDARQLKAAVAADRAARSHALGVEAARAAGNGSAAVAATAAPSATASGRSAGGGGGGGSVAFSAGGTRRSRGKTHVASHVKVTNAATAAALSAKAGAAASAAGVMDRNVGNGKHPVLFAWDVTCDAVASGALRIHPARGSIPPGGHVVVRVTLHAPAAPQLLDTDVPLLLGVSPGEMEDQARRLARGGGKGPAGIAQLSITSGSVRGSRGAPRPDPVHVPVALKSTAARDARVARSRAERRAARGQPDDDGSTLAAGAATGGGGGRGGGMLLNPATSNAALAFGQILLAGGAGVKAAEPKPAFEAAGIATVSGAVGVGPHPAASAAAASLRGARGFTAQSSLARAAAAERADADAASMAAAAPADQTAAQLALQASHEATARSAAAAAAATGKAPPSALVGSRGAVQAQVATAAAPAPPIGRLLLHVSARVSSEEEFAKSHGQQALAAFGMAPPPKTSDEARAATAPARPLLPAVEEEEAAQELGAASGAGAAPGISAAGERDTGVVGDVLTGMLADVLAEAGVAAAFQSLQSEQVPTFASIRATKAGAAAGGVMRSARGQQASSAGGDSGASAFDRAWVLDAEETQELVGRLMENTLLNTIREAAGGTFDVTSQPLNLHHVA